MDRERVAGLELGVDEAGYGPTLGPLAVGLAAASGGPLEDLVRATPGLAVGDSKRLFPRRGLAALELPVLAFHAAAHGHVPRRLMDLLGTAPEELGTHPWYAGLGTPVPLVASRSEVEDLAGALLDGADRSGVRPCALEVVLLLEGPFNARCAVHGSKAAVELELIAELVGPWLERGRGGRFLCDRLGGRKDYAEWLSGLFPFVPLSCTARDPGRSSYLVAAEARRWTADFLVKGEERSAAIGLASLAAKYAREVAMHHFNGWFLERAPRIARTAGYPEDARRFLAEIDELPELRNLVRRLVRTR